MSTSAVLRFFVFFFGTLGLFHFYVWARLVRDPHLPPPWRLALTLGVIGLGLLLVWGSTGDRLVPALTPTSVRWVGLSWLGILGFLMSLLLMFDAAELAAWIARRVGGIPAPDLERRVFLARAIAGVTAAVSAGLGAVALAEAARRVQVKRVPVVLKKLPAATSGYRIVQISDVHIGPTLQRAFLEEIVSQVNALKPDLVAITGDLVDGTVAEIGELMTPLKDLKAKDGVYFITGNHEYYSGAQTWLNHLPSLGVRPLRNERVAIGGPAGFDLAGIHDPTAKQMDPTHAPDLSAALAGRDPARPVVLLAHQPRQSKEAIEQGVDLQLSGHTHGGQVFPMTLLVHLVHPFVLGLHRTGDFQIYVSAGTGYWGPPMRLGTSSEITEILLMSA
jgi:predicted MPP superfamily phosphohydrolase